MIFPEIADRVKGFLGSRGGIQTLGLKSSGVGIDWYPRNGFYRIAELGANWSPAWSGESVNLNSALNHSVVWACNRIISESVGFIPAIMLQQQQSGKRVATEKPMYSALKNAPNDEITAQGFSEMLTSHCVLQGNSYAKIVRRSGVGTAIELHAIKPEMVNPDRERTGQKRLTYTVRDGNSGDKTYTVERGKPHDILHIRGLGWDGIKGYSVISMGRQSIGTAIAAERNQGRFWANGGRVPYVLSLEKDFKTDKEFDQFRADWERVYAEPHRAPILPTYIKDYKQTGLSMVDSQALETRLFHIHEICRWFLVSPHLVGDLSRATFSNIEQLALEFVKMTLATWLTRWEQELWRCVLTDEERAQGYFWKHNVNALLRGDFKTRMEGYASALQNGHLSVDEVRDLEDLNPIPDGAGEHYHIQLNMQALPGEGTPLSTQSAQLVRLTQ